MTDTGSTFLSFRSDIAGPSGSSNFVILDAALHSHDTQITALQGVHGVIYVPLIYQSPNFYTASGITPITSYTDGMIIDVSLNQTSGSGGVTININSIGTKSLLKYLTAGTTTNLAANDLILNKDYLFRYSFSAGAFIWINPTSGDQTNIAGTSGNFIYIASDNTFQDAGVANSAFVHLSGTETLTGAKTFSLPPNYVTQSIDTTALLSSASAPIVLIDTTSAAFVLTLPASPVTGEWFRFIDNTGQWATHNLTINPNSKNIDNSGSNVVLNSTNYSYEIYYDGTSWHSRTAASSAEVNTGADNFKGITPGALRSSVIGVLPDSYGTNYQITSSIGSNNLTIALKGLDGNDPSATNPVIIRAGNGQIVLTSALSITITAAMGDIFTWDAGKIQANDTQLFIYYINNNGTAQLGASPDPMLTTVATNFWDLVPNAQTGTAQFKNIVMSGTRNATNSCRVIGRLQVNQLDNNNWQIPTVSNVVNYPIYTTDWLTWTANQTG